VERQQEEGSLKDIDTQVCERCETAIEECKKMPEELKVGFGDVEKQNDAMLLRCDKALEESQGLMQFYAELTKQVKSTSGSHSKSSAYDDIQFNKP